MEEWIKKSDVVKALKPIAEQLSDGLQSDIASAIMSIPSADRWIPCTERLPSEQGQYLVTFPLCNGEPWVYVLNFCKGKFYETDDEWGDVEYDDVIAWMPLPEPWKGAENNKECHKPQSLYYRAFCEERKDSAYCDGCEFWY